MTGADIKVIRSHHNAKDELVSKNLQSALKDAMDLSNADYDTLEDIADGLEKMLHSWNDVQERRDMEYARLKQSLAKDTTQCHKRTENMKEALEDMGVRVSRENSPVAPHRVHEDVFVSPLKPCSPNSPQDAAEKEKRRLPEWANLLEKEEDIKVLSTKRKGGAKHPHGVKAMPLKKKPRKQIISVQIQDDKRDKGGDCTCDEADTSPHAGERKKWPPAKQSPLNFIKGKDSTGQLKKQIEELQIALLESATEYELKILQMKMQMLQNKNDQGKQQEQQQAEKAAQEAAEGEMHTVDCSRKQVSRLQKEKKDLTKEVFELRRRERMYQHQRKVLEDAQYRVNCLKRELMRREGQLVNVQLREKALTVRVSQLEEALKASSNKDDFVKLWHILPELHDWLHTMKKDGPVRLDHSHILQFQHYENQIAKVLETLPHKPDDDEMSVPFFRTCRAPHTQPPVPTVDKCRKKLPERFTRPRPKEVKREAEALQRELHKLAHPKPTKVQEKAGHSESSKSTTGSNQSSKALKKHDKQQQPHWFYGAAMLLGGLLFGNRNNA